MTIEWLVRGTEAHAFIAGARFSFCNRLVRGPGMIAAPKPVERCESCKRLVAHHAHGGLPKPQLAPSATDRFLAGERLRAELRVLWTIVIGGTWRVWQIMDEHPTQPPWVKLDKIEVMRWYAAEALAEQGDPKAMAVLVEIRDEESEAYHVEIRSRTKGATTNESDKQRRTSQFARRP